MNDAWGDLLAQEVSKRIALPVANEAALASVPAGELIDGRVFVAISEGSIWVYNGTAGAFRRINAVRTVRGVATGNVADLTAFTGVAGGTPNDGITYAAGDRILLPIQTTAAQCGVYKVGTVASGTAPLTRVADMPAGYALPLGHVVEVAPGGTLYGGTTWKAMATTTGGAVIGTNDPLFYPRKMSAIVTLASGIKALGATEGLWLFSTTKSDVRPVYDTPDTITLSVALKCSVADRTAGKVGTAAATVKAVKADATTNTADVSTVAVLVTNW